MKIPLNIIDHCVLSLESNLRFTSGEYREHLRKLINDIKRIRREYTMITERGSLLEANMKPVPRIYATINLLRRYFPKFELEKKDIQLLQNPEENLEEVGWILDELCDIVDQNLPDSYYIGGHPNDPADFGIWKHEDAPDFYKKGNGIVVTIPYEDDYFVDGDKPAINQHGEPTGNTIMEEYKSDRLSITRDSSWYGQLVVWE